MASDVTAIVSGIRGVAIFPRVLFNSSLDVNLYFRDASATALAWSGATGYTPRLRIRPSGWTGNLSRNGTSVNSIDLTDGSKTRPVVFYNGPLTGDATYNVTLDFGNRSDSALARIVRHGIVAGQSGANTADPWVFNDLSSSLHADAVWAGTGVEIVEYSANTSFSVGLPGFSLIVRARNVGAQAALSFTNPQNLFPTPDTQVDVLKAGSASEKAVVWLRVTRPPIVAVTSFSQITSGWSCTVPFTDGDFAIGQGSGAGGGPAVYPWNDYDCEITVTRNSDSVVMAVVTSKIRVFRKQIELTL